MSTSVVSVVSHFPDAENGFTTTLASTISSGAATVPLNSVSGYTNGQPAVFVVDPSDPTKKQTFTGIIDTSGVQLTSVVWTAGTNQTHSGGATVVDYATATHIAMISKGILVHADQDGTLKAGAVDNAAVLASDVVTTAKILDASVTNDKLANQAWQSWSPTFTNLSGGTLNYARYTQVGKTIFFRLKYTLAGAGVAGSVQFTTPTTMSSEYDVAGISPINSNLVMRDVSAPNSVQGHLAANDSTHIQLRTYIVGVTYLVDSSITSTIPFTWASPDILLAVGEYETA